MTLNSLPNRPQLVAPTSVGIIAKKTRHVLQEPPHRVPLRRGCPVETTQDHAEHSLGLGRLDHHLTTQVVHLHGIGVVMMCLSRFPVVLVRTWIGLLPHDTPRHRTLTEPRFSNRHGASM